MNSSNFNIVSYIRYWLELDGSELDGPDDLRDALVADSDIYVVAFTEKLMTYAIGRGLLTVEDSTLYKSFEIKEVKTSL